MSCKDDVMIIIPACGSASRIGHIPKFLLPISEKNSLLKNILEITNENDCKNVWISTRPEYGNMLYEYTKLYSPHIKVTLTDTMSETINQYKDVSVKKTIMVMPDTYINDRKIFIKIYNMLNDCDLVVCVWKIKDYQRGKLGQCLIDDNDNIIDVIDKDPNCDYEYAWGCLGWNKKFWNFIDPKTSHIGYGLVPAIKSGLNVKALFMDGDYNDCGTINEYKNFLNNV